MKEIIKCKYKSAFLLTFINIATYNEIVKNVGQHFTTTQFIKGEEEKI